jgi:hypothetical protein
MISTTSADVRYWHKADVPCALSNVCFEGKNGHDAGVTPFPLVTQSGHCRVRLSGQSLCPRGFVDLLGSASVPSTSGQLGDKLTLRTAKQAARRPTLAHSKTHEARKAVSEIHITKDGPYLVSGNLPLAEVTIGTNAAGESMRWEWGRKFQDQARYCDGTHAKIGLL